MLSRVLRLASKKSIELFLGHIVCFTHREITQKIFKCTNCLSYDTKIDAICHVNKLRMHAYIQILIKFVAIKLLFSSKAMAMICDTKVL